MSEEPRRRSRFDKTEPEPKKSSRFDRRSRSPSSRNSETQRSRSPLAQGSGTPDSSKKDPAAAAAAAAAKINAQLESKRGIQHVEVPPIRSSSTAGPKAETTVSNVNGEIYQQDGDYIKDIEVNDLRNRYTLTKGATQKMSTIKDETGADVTTRGNYYPDKSMATPSNPPLYLHVTSQTKEGLEQAVAKIDELMQQELPNLVDERRFRPRREPEPFERDEQGRRKWPEERIPIDLEPIPGFNLRAQVVGAGGAYVKHIQSETRCRVQIKGRGSGFLESSTQQESDEPMYLHVAGPDPNEVKHARELCEDLLLNVKSEYQTFKERGGQRGGYGRGGDRGRGDHYGGGDRSGGRGGYDQQDQYGGQQQGYGAAAQPVGGAAVGADPNNPFAGMTYEQAMTWAAYYGQQYAAAGSPDPYEQFGGIVPFVQNYYAYYAAQAGAQQTAADQAYGNGTSTPGFQQQQPAAPGAQGYDQPPPPPPPSSNDAPPPPPPGSGSPPGTYNSVPPPPGM